MKKYGMIHSIVRYTVNVESVLEKLENRIGHDGVNAMHIIIFAITYLTSCGFYCFLC